MVAPIETTGQAKEYANRAAALRRMIRYMERLQIWAMAQRKAYALEDGDVHVLDAHTEDMLADWQHEIDQLEHELDVWGEVMDYTPSSFPLPIRLAMLAGAE